MAQEVPTTLASGRSVNGDMESSFALVLRAREGDQAARNELCARYLPRLRRWAHGRLPIWAGLTTGTYNLLFTVTGDPQSHAVKFAIR